MKKELLSLIDECTAEINDIEKRISELRVWDKEILYLTHYALMRASGVTEFVYRSIVVDYFSSLSDKRIDTYLEATVKRGSMSAKYKMMCNLLAKFDTQWKKDFQNAVHARPDGKKLILSSNSLVINRHSFAHGRASTTAFKTIKEYYLDVLELIKILDSIVR